MLMLVGGDITKLEVDAIVNAANAALSGGGGVDGAIHAAAGPELLAACRALGSCEPGDAKITPGFALLAKHVIHAVGPVWRGGDYEEERLLRSCYRRALELAIEAGAQSIAFPCISTGAYRFPRPLAAAIAIDETRHSTLPRIVFCCFDPGDIRLYRRSADTVGVQLH